MDNSTPHNAIEIRNLNKTYTSRKNGQVKHALEDISLTVKRGSIFGLLGPNGAGKSTLINIMAGLVMKTSGTVTVWDRDLDQDPRNVKAAIGIVPQELNFDAFFSPAKLLDLMAGLYGVPKHGRRTMELLRMMGLEDKADAYTRTLSGGMKRRLMVAKAMVHSPPILVLDEPTAGVDVELRKQLWENVRALNREGVTILLTTHYLEEAEELCDNIAILNHGKLIINEPKETLLARIDAKEIRFTLDRDCPALPDSLKPFNTVQNGPRSLTIRYTPKEHTAEALIKAVHDGGYGIADLVTKESTLEDIFLQLTQAKA